MLPTSAEGGYNENKSDVICDTSFSFCELGQNVPPIYMYNKTPQLAIK